MIKVLMYNENLESPLPSEIPEGLLRAFAANAIHEYYESTRPENLMVNYEQMEKYANMINYFSQLAQENRLEMELPDPTQTNLNGELTIHSYCLDFDSYALFEFCEIFDDTMSIEIDAMIDGLINITIVVRNIYVERSGYDDIY